LGIVLISSSLPQNPIRDVHRVLAHFGLSNEAEVLQQQFVCVNAELNISKVVLSSVGPTSLPVGKPAKLSEILSGYVELSQPATTKDLGKLSEVAASNTTLAYLEKLKTDYNDAVQAQRLSVFDILQSHADIALSIGAFLQMLPPMRVRQYSISSSPLWNPTHITVTFNVLDVPSMSKVARSFLGVGSNYLASMYPGDRVQMSVRPSAAAFNLPEDPMTPVVMFCSGSGLAPMRGFIQDARFKRHLVATSERCFYFSDAAPQSQISSTRRAISPSGPRKVSLISVRRFLVLPRILRAANTSNSE
jgi:cytochrome P450/NADPH-cytochrome P450 reductase